MKYNFITFADSCLQSFSMTSSFKRLAMVVAMVFIYSLHASATQFITDIKLIGGTKAECNSLKTSLTNEGWTVIDYDLNKGASGDYIFLLYKADNNTDGINRGYITNFYISSEGDVADDSHTVDGRTYNLASFAGGDHFKEKKGDLNSGTGHGSANIHLYYTKNLFTDYRAVTGITFNDTSTGAVVWNGSGNPADLNAGCGAETPYIYMHISTATAMTGHKPQSSLEACSAGKNQISVRGWAYDPDITAQSITVQVKIYQNDGTTLYKTQNLTANQANANAGVSGNHGFAYTFTNMPPATYKVQLFALDYNGDGNTQIGTTRTVTVTGSQPSGRIDACAGGVGQITISGWAYDPDATAQSIGVQVKIYESNGTTLYKTVDLTADRQRNDINNTYNITGQHGYSAAIDIDNSGTFKVMVYAIDTNGDGNPQIGSTQTVNVTPAIYSVSFDANGGSGTMDSQIFTKHIAQELNNCAFSRRDYFFNGWNTKADGSGTSYTDGQSITVSGNTTLYAQWKEGRVIDLKQYYDKRGSQDCGYYHAKDGDILTGGGNAYVEVVISDGARVTLRNARIEPFSIIRGLAMDGISCAKGFTIILEGYNSVKGYDGGDGINCSQSTLTICGNGALEVITDINLRDPTWSRAIRGNVTFNGDFIDNSDDNGRHRTVLSRNPHLPDDADNGSMINVYNGQSGINVTLSGRTLYKDGTWNTLCLPFNLSAEQVAQQLAPTKLMTLSSSTFSGGVLTLNFEDATSIEAGKPYIIKWASGQNITDPTFTGVTINNTTAPVETQLVDMIGTYKPFDSTTGLLLDSHNPDNGAFRAALSVETQNFGGLTFGGWYTDSKFKTPVTTIPFANDGTVKLYGKFTNGNTTVTLAKEGYSTYYNSLADAVLPTGMKARIITAKAGGQTLTYQTVADGDLSAAATRTVPAGTAVMLQVAPAAATQNINMTLTAPAAPGIGQDNLLHGSDTETTTTGGSQYYKLSYNRDGDNKTIGWYWGAQDAGAFTSGAHKAWLALPSNAQFAPLRSIGLPAFNEGTTDVTIIPYPVVQQDVWYDMYGRMLNEEPTTQGLYIHNNQTIMIK